MVTTTKYFCEIRCLNQNTVIDNLCVENSEQDINTALLYLIHIWGGWSQSEQCDTHWTSHQFITKLTCRDRQPFTLTFTLTGNFEKGSRSTRWEPRQAQEEHANSARKGPAPARSLTIDLSLLNTALKMESHSFIWKLLIGALSQKCSKAWASVHSFRIVRPIDISATGAA